MWPDFAEIGNRADVGDVGLPTRIEPFAIGASRP